MERPPSPGTGSSNDSAQGRIRQALRPGSRGSDPPTAAHWGWKRGVFLLLVASLVGAGAAALVVALGPSDAVVVIRSGDLKPSAGPLDELRVFGTLTVFADPEFRQPRSSPDILSVMLLTALAGVSATGYLLARGARGAVRERLPAFLGLASLGAAWLAFDELLGLHETIGANLPVDSLVGVRHNDDAIVALYALAGMAFIGRYRLTLRSSRRALAILLLGLALTVVAAGIDVVTPGGAEELVEVAAAAALLVGFVVLVIDNLAEAVVGGTTARVQPPETVGPRGGARSDHW